MTVLVTGATGFVGGPVCRHLVDKGHHVVAAVRRPDVFLPLGVEARLVSDLGPQTCWKTALAGCDTVIHLAARAHVMRDRERDPLALFRRINRDGTLVLAEQAAAAGVKRFVYVSSIKVNGESTPADRPYQGDDPPAPKDPYGQAKAEAELGLTALAERTGLSLAVVRPPLVHGPGVKGNLAALMRILKIGLPLPFGAIHNRRSLVGVDNLADALVFLANNQATGCYLIRDDENISTSELILCLAAELRKRARLLPVPAAVLHSLGVLCRKQSAMRRLTESLIVDDTPLRTLGWVPPASLTQGLAKMASAYRKEYSA